MEAHIINELLATEVMGFRYVTFPKSHVPHIKHWINSDDSHRGALSFSPTTDMNQAMECVEKSDLKGFSLTEGNGLFHCQINGVSVFDKSAPLAICKAILKAKGIEIQ
jgi:hypothetical protein